MIYRTLNQSTQFHGFSIVNNISVFTPGEKSRLDAAGINATGRYLLCCICSAPEPVTLSDLSAYTGYERERLRKAVKQLANIGVIEVTRLGHENLYEASFV